MNIGEILTMLFYLGVIIVLFGRTVSFLSRHNTKKSIRGIHIIIVGAAIMILSLWGLLIFI